MPRKLSRAVRLLIGAGVATLAIGAAPAAASACEFPATTKAFAPFGDAGDYFLAPGGDFEALTWQASYGARLVGENEPFGLAPGSHSVRLDREDYLTSPPVCVSRDTPHLRFVAKRLGSGPLELEVRAWENQQVTGSWSVTLAPGEYQRWAPSGNVDLNTSAFLADQTGTVTLRFKSQGTWLIDNVFIDPYRR
jgi:hypothetical protein